MKATKKALEKKERNNTHTSVYLFNQRYNLVKILVYIQQINVT